MSIAMIVRLEGDGTLIQRLYRGLRAAILDGRLAPGARLPSTRALATGLGVSRNVVLAAFDQLLDEGYAEARVGSGTYVAPIVPDRDVAPWRPRPVSPARTGPLRLSRGARRAIESKPLPAAGSHPSGRRLAYDFRYGRPGARDFPHATWARLVSRRARAMSIQSMWYSRARGFPPLREAIADYVRRARGVNATADQIVIVSGTQQGLDLVARMLIDPGDRVAVEEPTYQAARQVFQAAGARIVATPVDEHGLQVDRLPRDRRIRLVYVTPSHQFPLGAILPLARRLELVRWAAACGAHVFEDDYNGEFRYGDRAVEAVQGLDRAGRVIYAGSFSKVMFPSLRVGYLVMPEHLMPAATALKYLADVHSSLLVQEVLTDFLVEGHFERHLRRMRAIYAARRQVMLDAIAEHLAGRVDLVGTAAGIHVVIELRGVASGALPALVGAAAAREVGIYPITPHYHRAPRRGALILGYACLTEHEIRTGVKLLGEVLRGAGVRGSRSQ